jgi:hypothetical protein
MARHAPLDLRILLLAFGVALLVAVILSRCLMPTPPPPAPESPTVVVLDPTPRVAVPPTWTATPVPTERLPMATRTSVPPLILVDTPEPTPSPVPPLILPAETRVPIQKG